MKLGHQLDLDRCPHCRVDKPSLHELWGTQTKNYDKTIERFWKNYSCTRCGGVVLAVSYVNEGVVHKMYPSGVEVAHDLPTKAKEFLSQAISSLHAPAGCVMLCASAVDAMFKEKNYKGGSLYHRIDKAAEDHLITSDMASWAHEVRLDANDQRHVAENVSLPSEADAQKCVNFVVALGKILYVLPAMVKRGLKETKNKK